MGHLGGEKIQRTEQVRAEQAGQRVDQAAAELFDGFSRSRLQAWIKDGVLTVNGNKAKPKDKLTGNESLSLEVVIEPELEDQPQSIELDIVYEDEDLLVINKPTGLVVHPAAGHADGTLLNGLLHHDERLNSLPRAGIVHRLDRDTTGLMVVARSLEAHTSLVSQLQDKSLFRQYEAIAVGVMTGGGKVDAPMGRHPVDRKKQAVLKEARQECGHPLPGHGPLPCPHPHPGAAGDRPDPSDPRSYGLPQLSVGGRSALRRPPQVARRGRARNCARRCGGFRVRRCMPANLA